MPERVRGALELKRKGASLTTAHISLLCSSKTHNRSCDGLARAVVGQFNNITSIQTVHKDEIKYGFCAIGTAVVHPSRGKDFERALRGVKAVSGGRRVGVADAEVALEI